MEMCLDAQGQLTLLSVIQSGPNSNSPKRACISWLPATLKRIRSIAIEKKWRHFFRHSRAANSVVSCRILTKFKHICMSLLPARMKKIQLK